MKAWYLGLTTGEMWLFWCGVVSVCVLFFLLIRAMVRSTRGGSGWSNGGACDGGLFFVADGGGSHDGGCSSGDGGGGSCGGD